MGNLDFLYFCYSIESFKDKTEYLCHCQIYRQVFTYLLFSHYFDSIVVIMKTAPCQKDVMSDESLMWDRMVMLTINNLCANDIFFTSIIKVRVCTYIITCTLEKKKIFVYHRFVGKNV